MAVTTASGAKFFIGPADPTQSVDTQGEFEALSYTQVGEVEDIGEFGDIFNTTEFTALEDARVRRFKTTKDAGETTLVVGLDPNDAGQQALVTAFDSLNDFAIKITLNDEGTGSPSNPTTWYFRAQINGKRIIPGGSGNVVRRQIPMAINSDVIEIAAV